MDPVPTGTLIAAALETVGYHSLASVLEQLSEMIFELGGLFYALAAVGCVTVLVLTQNPRGALWLLVSPGLFYFLVFFRTSAPGAEWVFGTFSDERDGFNELEDLISYEEDAEVPWFFNRYNVLVSAVFNELIKMFTYYDSFRAQVRFMTKARMTDVLFRADIQDPGLQALIVDGLSSQCAPAMNSLREIAYARVNPSYAYSSPTLRQSLANLPSLYNGMRFALPPDSPSRVYLLNLIPRLATLDSGVRSTLVNALCEGGEDIDTTTFFPTEIELADTTIGAMTCKQIWCWTALGTYLEALRLAELVECRYTPELLHTCKEDELLGTDLDSTRNELMDEIWYEIVDKMLAEDDAETLGDEPDLRHVPLLITAILLRKALVIDPRTYMISEFASSGGVFTSGSTYDLSSIGNQDLDQTRTLNARHETATALRYHAFLFSSRLPYVQGGVLFCLAVLYPFFCLFVLIPGKGRAFLSWMSLWAWAKSWDVGYSLVMIADELLWALMPRQTLFRTLVVDSGGPLALFEGAFRSDVSYSISTYYILLSSMVLAVPMVLAHFILGMQSAIAGVVFDRLQGLGSRISNDQKTIAERRYNDLKKSSNSESSQSSSSSTSNSYNNDYGGLSGGMNLPRQAPPGPANGLARPTSGSSSPFSGGFPARSLASQGIAAASNSANQIPNEQGAYRHEGEQRQQFRDMPPSLASGIPQTNAYNRGVSSLEPPTDQTSSGRRRGESSDSEVKNIEQRISENMRIEKVERAASRLGLNDRD